MEVFLEKVSFILKNFGSGDRYIECEGFCRSIYRKEPYKYDRIRREIFSNLNKASEVSGLHPDRCKQIASWLSYYKRQKMSAYVK